MRPLFRPGFLEDLRHLRSRAISMRFRRERSHSAHEPLLRVRGPLLQAQILESLLLNVINFQTLVATKAARICHVAAPGTVLEFGLRRAQGESGSDGRRPAARRTWAACGNLERAGRKRYGIPVRGTHAHSWVMSFPNELESFAKYAEVLPNNCIFLVDTFDSIQGVFTLSKPRMQPGDQGHDSLVYGSTRRPGGAEPACPANARRGGIGGALIVASNDLDDNEIELLEHAECGSTCGASVRDWRPLTINRRWEASTNCRLSATRKAAGSRN